MEIYLELDLALPMTLLKDLQNGHLVLTHAENTHEAYVIVQRDRRFHRVLIW